jgi:hypothetical protein
MFTLSSRSKLTIRSIAIDFLATQFPPEEAKVVYIYFDHTSPRGSQSAQGIASSILRQLLLQSDHIPTEVEEIYETFPSGSSNVPVVTITKVLALWTQRISIYAVFDALDECDDGQRQDIVELLRCLRQIGVRLLISSRPYLSSYLSKVGDAMIFNIRADESDLVNYAIARLSRAGIKSDPRLQERCVQLMAGVEGQYDPKSGRLTRRFLLAKFQLDHILRYREPRKRWEAAKTVPKTLGSAYHDILSRMKEDEKVLALKILSWLANAQRTLYMNELREVLVLEEGDTELERRFLLEPSDVVECCRSLVQYDMITGLVHLSHYTVQQFLILDIPKQLLSVSEIAKSCLNYLSLDDFGSGPCIEENSLTKRLAAYEFSDYVVRYWSFHCRAAEADPRIQTDILVFLLSENKRNSMLQMECYLTPESENSNPFSISSSTIGSILHTLAKYGFAIICNLVLQTTVVTRER